ncbi:MAG: anti-sigma factor antagonist [Firmicutes bacterium]|nr:anti-sigma factor antagonist [Bacillota bacterium]
MNVQSKTINNTLYISISGELDEHTAEYARLTLDGQLHSLSHNQVIIDLNALSFMDSTGVGVLIGRYKKLKERNVPVFVCNPSPHADKIFKLTNLYEIMPRIN